MSKIDGRHWVDVDMLLSHIRELIMDRGVRQFTASLDEDDIWLLSWPEGEEDA